MLISWSLQQYDTSYYNTEQLKYTICEENQMLTNAHL